MNAADPAVTPPRPGAPECRFCASPLTPHQAMRGICAAPECRTRSVQEASRQVFRRDWQAYVGQMRLAIETAADGLAAGVRLLGAEPEAVAYGVVPYQNRPVVPQPASRRAAFAEHLDEIIATSFAGGGRAPDMPRREVGEQPEAPLALSACATCQGKCCFLGGETHAFLDSATIRLVRARDPQATPEEIRARYLSHLPERSVEHSCLYHGARGCTLPRRERADICNRYHCQMQTALLRRFREMRPDAAVIVASEDDAGSAVAVHDAAGWRPVPADAAAAPEHPRRVAHVLATALAQLPADLPAEAEMRPAPHACAWCGAAIDRHAAVSHRSCGRPACERKRIDEGAEAIQQRKVAQHAALVRRMRESFVESTGGVAAAIGLPGDASLGVVPLGSGVLVPVSPDRRAALAEHLDTIAAEASAADPDDGTPDAPPRPEPALVVAACATCRGHCCRGGGDTAYLSADQALRFRRRESAASTQDFRARYLGFVPDLSVQGSCIYNGESGCTLPREARSDICNSFRCHGLSALVAESHAGQDAVIVAVDERQRARRVATFDGRTRTLGPVRDAGRDAG